MDMAAERKVQEVVIVGAARTPIGAFQGSLSSLPAPRLGAVAIKAALERAGVKPEEVKTVFMGHVLQGGVGQAPARQASLYAGIPKTVPCVTVNKVCGSGLEAVIEAARVIALGEVDVLVAGGMESMSNAPYFTHSMRNGARMGNVEMKDLMIHDGLWDPYNDMHMGMCGEKCAADFQFSRSAQDEYARETTLRAQKAQKEGAFKAEIAAADAINQALGRARLKATDIDLWEINEAFAVVAMANNKLLGITPDKVNVRGGAVVLGHPIGASGCRLLVTLLYAMKDLNKKRGIASLCIGGGEGIALIVERD